jgi:hypothetical protein
MHGLKKKKQNELQDNLPPGQNINSPYSRYEKEFQILIYILVNKGVPLDEALKR